MILTDNRRLTFGPRLLKNICIALERLDGVTPDEMREGKIKPGCEHIIVQIIFDINMDGKLTRKARLAVAGHTKATPSLITYSSAFLGREL